MTSSSDGRDLDENNITTEPLVEPVSSTFDSISLANGIPEFVPRGVQSYELQASEQYGATFSSNQFENANESYVLHDPNSAESLDMPNNMLEGGGQNQSYYNQLNSIPVDVGSRHTAAGVVSLHFDRHEQLIWQGNSVGHVTSYFGTQLRKYSSFQVHQTNPIRQLESLEQAVISLTQNALRVSQKGGITLLDAPFYDCDLECMLLLDQTNLLLGGHQPSTLLFELQTAQIVSRIPCAQNDVVLMRYSDTSFCFGHSNGSISFVDPNTLNSIKCIQSHSGSLSDFSVSGNTLISCGFSAISNDQLIPDNFINVYDIRNFRLVSSYQFDVEPFLVRFFPMYNNRALVLSQMGQFQIVDPSGLAIPESLVLHKVTLPNQETVITACDLSSTSHAIVFGDSSGLLQLYGDSSEPTFNEFENPTEFPNPPSTNMYVAYDDYSVPFSFFPFPYTHACKPLLSEWPPALSVNRFYDSPKIPEEIASKIEYVDFIGYAPYPVGWTRNRVPYKPQEYLEHLPESISSRDGSPLDENGCKLYPDDMPAIYHKVSVQTLFAEAFPEDSSGSHKSSSSSSSSANKCFPTIENSSINGYSNMLMYAISTIEPLASYIRSHLCKRELCLTCEVSCIFDTLKQAPPDYSFTPYNFLRVFCMLPETTALGLVISEFDDNLNSSTSYPKLLPSFNRFLLQQLHQDFQRDEEMSSSTSFGDFVPKRSLDNSTEADDETEKKNNFSLSGALNELMGLVTEQTSTCKCGNELSRKSTNFTTPLIYPDLFNSNSSPKIYSFADVVKHSLTSESTTQSWCNKCHKYQPANQKKKIVSLPQVLSLNCQLDKQRDISFWRVQQKLAQDPSSQADLTAPSISVGMCRFGNTCSRKDCKFRHEKDTDVQASIEKFCSSDVSSGIRDYEWAPVRLTLATDETEATASQKTEYELVASVLHVPASNSRGHMVCRVKMDGKYFLVNDTSVHQISEIDFNKFNLNWTVPCVLFYTNVDVPQMFTEVELKDPVKREFLSGEQKLIEVNPGLKKVFAPIGSNEDFSASDFVGLDMNIVANCKQETDINADGSYKTITSSESSIVVTRVVCFRGNKFENIPSIPLIDDHTQSKETVVEYINKLPSLEIPSHGGKHLATFKQTFLKLKYLVSRKVTFIGHNIELKLRKFNLYVPKNQIQDTANLYKLSRQKTLPLKFLASHFKISYPRPDVSRDCFVAMQLYKNYLKITNEGKTMQAFRMSLQEIYNLEAAIGCSRANHETRASPMLSAVTIAK